MSTVSNAAIPAALLLLTGLAPLLPAAGDPTEGPDPWGPQYRAATWSFDMPQYALENATIGGGEATLATTAGAITWTAGPDFTANASAESGITAIPTGLSLAGDPGELVANGDFASPAGWTTASATNVFSGIAGVAAMGGNAGASPVLFDGMNGTANWVAQGSGASLSLNMTDFVEPSASITVTWNPLFPAQYGGAQRALGGANWSGYTGLRVWTNTSESGAQVYIEIVDTAFTLWDSLPQQPVANVWEAHDFDFPAAGIDLTSLLSVELRFTNLTGGTRNANVDNLTFYTRTAFNETAAINQTVTKTLATAARPGEARLRFDLTAVAASNVTANLDVTLSNASGTFTATLPITAPVSNTTTLDPSLDITAAGDYNLTFALRVDANTTETARVDVRIDNVSLVAAGYANGSYLSTTLPLGSAVNFETVAVNVSLPPGTAVTLLVRSGNSTGIDGSWSGWGAHGPGAEAAGIPAGQYVQILAWMNTTSGLVTPTLDDLTLTYWRYLPSSLVTTAEYAPAETVFRWHNLTWSGTVPAGTSLSFETSTDNSSWAAANGGVVDAAGGPSIWIRALLMAVNTSLTPRVADVTLHYEVLGVLDHIDLDPPGPVTITADGTVDFTATAYDAYGHRLIVPIAWATTDPGGTVNATGQYAAGTAGTWNITATSGGVTATAQVIVTPGILDTLQLLPSSGTYEEGASVDLVLSGFDADGNAVAVTNTSWAHPAAAVLFQNATRLSLQMPPTPGPFNVTATSLGIAATADLTITATPLAIVNLQPLTRVEDSGTYEWDLTANAQGDDPANLSWSVTAADSTLAFLATGAFGDLIVRVTPKENATGSTTLTLTLKSRSGQTAMATTTLTISAVNDPPVFAKPDTIRVEADRAYTFDYRPYITDIDTPLSQLVLTTTDAAHAAAGGLNVTYLFGVEFLSGPLVPIGLNVSDGTNWTRQAQLVNVTDNPPPIARGTLPAVTFQEDRVLSNAFPALDLDTLCTDATNLTYSAHASFVTAALVNATGVLTANLSAPPDRFGTDYLVLRCTDTEGAFDELYATVTVTPVNDAPTIATIPTLFVSFNATATFDLSRFIVDVDGDPLSLSTDDARATFASFTLSLLYPQETLGPNPSYDLPLTLTANDTVLADSRVVNVHVSNNAPPRLLQPLPDLFYPEDSPVSERPLSLFFADDDEPGGSAALDYTLLASPLTALTLLVPGAVNFTLSFPVNYSGDVLVEVFARDSYGARAFTAFTVHVAPVNDAPVLSGVPTRWVVAAGSTAYLDLEEYVTDDGPIDQLLVITSSRYVEAYGLLLIAKYPVGSPPSDLLRVTVSDTALMPRSDTVTIQVEVTTGVTSTPTPAWILFVLAAIVAAGVAVIALTRRPHTFEDAFLLVRDGRLVSHKTRRKRADRDEDIYAAMIAAISEFTRDSFREEGEHLKRFESEGNRFLVERGQHVYMGAIYGGEEPSWASESMQSLIKDIEERYGEKLAHWTGDVDDLPGVGFMVESFVLSRRYRNGAWRKRPSEQEPSGEGKPE